MFPDVLQTRLFCLKIELTVLHSTVTLKAARLLSYFQVTPRNIIMSFLSLPCETMLYRSQDMVDTSIWRTDFQT